MVATTAGDVMDLSAALLNDRAKRLYSYVVQLPYLKSAADDLDIELHDNGINVQLSVCEVAANVGDDTLTLPCSFFLPIKLEERAQTSTDPEAYSDMQEEMVEPPSRDTQNVGQWAFRNNQIQLMPFTENKTIRVTFRRSLVSIADETTVTEIRKGKNFLAFRTAALCAEFIGRNKERADSLNFQGQIHLEKLMAVFVKNTQGIRVRRMPFRVGRSTVSR